MKNFRKDFKKENSHRKKDSSPHPFEKFKKKNTFKKKAFKKEEFKKEEFKKEDRNDEKRGEKKWEKPSVFYKKLKENPKTHSRSFSKPKPEDTRIRLNKYIANAGICSRREADTLIENGLISVNGKIVSQLGTKISPDDVVKYGGETLRKERNVYVLLNKPKDYITTVKDTHDRRTVMELVKNAGKERIYPVGRLDRNTTGVLLLTNDGELAKKLTHPKHGAKKIYHVETDKNVEHRDLKKLTDGVELEEEDGTKETVKADEAQYSGEHLGKNQLSLVLHAGKNRVVRRMLETLGYRVNKLDRVFFAGLTKKGLERGRWRYLSEKEVGFLKMIR